jgi:hypothetical protein
MLTSHHPRRSFFLVENATLNRALHAREDVVD